MWVAVLLCCLCAAQGQQVSALAWPQSPATFLLPRVSLFNVSGVPAGASSSAGAESACTSNATGALSSLATDILFFAAADCAGTPLLQLRAYDVTADLATLSASLYLNASSSVLVLNAADLRAVTPSAPAPLYNGSAWLVPVSASVPVALYETSAGQTLVVSRNASSDVLVSAASIPGSLSLALGQRLVWSSSPSGAPFYPRLCDAQGSVFPASDLRYVLAFNPSGSDAANSASLTALTNYSRPLSGSVSVWATPFFRSSAVFFFRDLFSVGGDLLHVAVADANGFAPTATPSASVPVFESYFGTSSQGVDCQCNFGPQPQCV